VKRVRARHMQAPSSPQQLASVAGVFTGLQHHSVVVPELLNALSSQVRRVCVCVCLFCVCVLCVCVWGGGGE